MEFRFKTDEVKTKFKENFEGKNVRIFLDRKSWMGAIFDWVLDEPNEEDTEIEVEGANVVLDPKVIEHTPYMNIDYKQLGDFDPDFVINFYK